MKNRNLFAATLLILGTPFPVLAQNVDDKTANSTPKYLDGKSKSEKSFEKGAKNEARVQAARKAAEKLRDQTGRAAKAAAKGASKLGKRSPVGALLVPSTAEAPTKSD